MKPFYLLYWSQIRDENQRKQRLKQATFPVHKTLDTFDFHLMPSLNKNRLLTLAQGEFVEKNQNVLLVGNSGTGKTHLATALGMEMVQRGNRVKFTTTAQLVEALLIAKEEHTLLVLEKQWLNYDVIICDELGYVPFTKMGAELLIQFLSSRYERASTIITSMLNGKASAFTSIKGSDPERSLRRCHNSARVIPHSHQVMNQEFCLTGKSTILSRMIN